MSDGSTARRTRGWYAAYYRKKGAERNDLIRNPEVLFQTLAFEASIIYALEATHLNPALDKVLDVGCGGG